LKSLRRLLAESVWAAGIDVIRLRSLRHPIGRIGRLLASAGIDLVVDVGANRGQFAKGLRRAGYAGRILSIEPLDAPFLMLARAAAEDDAWTVIQSAVGSETGVATMYVAANDGASSSFLPMLDLHARWAPDAQVVGEERVQTATLDDLVRPALDDQPAVFTKIDAQGFELQVLAGGVETLARSTLVQLEMSLRPLYLDAPSYRDVIDFMNEHGFCLIGLEPGFTSATGVQLQIDGIFARDAAARVLSGPPAS
jgi:FkbM family methyltransferase